MSSKIKLLTLLGITAILAYFTFAAPTQSGTSWKDNFSDSTGISTISYLNFSAGNISISNSPWFYPNHEYRKPITINGSTSAQTDYQIAINLTTAIYNNTGLVGSWHFSEGTGNRTADSSGYGNDGTMYGGMNTTLDGNLSSGWVSAGKFGNALRFDGVNDYVQNSSTLTGIPIGSSARTVEAWVNIAGLPTSSYDNVIFAYGSEAIGQAFILQQIQATNRLLLQSYGDDLEGTSAISTNTWYHIAVTYNGSLLAIYVNGILDASAAKSYTTVLNSNGFRIGESTLPSYGGRYFNGSIDEVRIYNRSLSATEIAEQYRAGKARLDYQDLRFTWLNSTSSAEQNISHWLENDNLAWVKVPNVTASSVANTTLFMYYGNPLANDAQNGTGTFEVFDDFNGADNEVIGNGWTVKDPQVTIDANRAKLVNPPTGGDPWAYRDGQNNGIVITNDVYLLSASGYPIGGVAVRAPTTGVWQNPTGAGYGWVYDKNANLLRIIDNRLTVDSVSLTLPADTWLTGEMIIKSNDNLEIRVWQKGNPRPSTATKTYATAPVSTGTKYAFGINGNTGTSVGYADNFRVRKYASPEPNVLSVGAEQNKPRSGSVGSVQIVPPSSFLQWQNFSADSLLGWQYKKEINISNTAGNLTNYQVNVLLINGTNFNSSKAKANGDDIRFTAPLSYSGGGKWLYKKEITVSNRINPSTLTDYQVLIPLEGVGGTGYNFDFSKAKSDGSDIRFYDPDTKSELSYWVESWNSTALSAKIWVKIPSIAGNSDKRVWIWYGNPSATAAANGTNTFVLFDDFNDGIQTSWTDNPGGSWTESGGIRSQTSTTAAFGKYSYITLSGLSEYIVGAKFRAPVIGINDGRMGVLLDRDTGNDAIMAVNYGSVTAQTQNAPNNDGVGWGTLGNNGFTLNINTWYMIEGYRGTNIQNSRIWQTNTPIPDWQGSGSLTNSANTQVGLMGGYDKVVDFDFFYVRKYTPVEPTVNVSSSEFSINSSYVEVPYWIESWNASANSSVWAKVPFLQNGTNTTIYMYYGNAEAGAASNGANTFEFFDDFSGDLSKWTVTQTGGTVQISNGELNQSGGSTWNQNGVASIYNITRPAVIEWKIRSENSRIMVGYGSYPINYQAGIYFYDNTGPLWGSQIDNGWTTFTTTPLTTDRLKLVLNPTTGVQFYINDVLKQDTTNSRDNSKFVTNKEAGTPYFDDIRVRKYASPEPNSTVSTTDTSGDFSAGVADINYKILRNAQFADWKYRKAITINGSTSAQTDYQIAVNLTTAIYNNTGLVGSWHFNDGSGNRTADSSGYGNDGTMYGGMNTTLDANLTSGWVSAGKFGNALKFDGADDYVNVSSVSQVATNGPLTITAWAKATSTTMGQAVMSIGQSQLNGAQFIVRMFSDSAWSFSTCTGGTKKITMTSDNGASDDDWICSPDTTNLNQWYFVAASYNPSDKTYRLYVDGVQKATRTITNNLALTDTNLRIGRDAWSGNNLNGTIDEVRIYNRSLSATEIAEQYRAGKARLDYQDLRFTWLNSTSSAEQNISHWLENDNLAWVKVPNVTASTVANTTVYMYYGNPSATNNNSLGGNNTFEFFGDNINKFSFTNPTKWSLSNNILTSSNSAGNTGGSLIGITRTDFIYETIMKAPSQPSENYGLDVRYTNYDSNVVSLYFGRTSGVMSIWLGAANGWAADSASFISSGVPYAVKFVVTGNNVYGYADANQAEATTLRISGTTAEAGTVIGFRAGNIPGQQFDTLRIRKYASPEPSTLSVGAEQNNTLCSGIIAEQAKSGYSITGCTGNATPISLFAVLETSDPQLKTPRLRQWNLTWSVIPTPPQIVLNTPLNNSINNTRNINFTFTPTDSDGFSSCELWTNESGSFASTLTSASITSGALNGINWTFSQDGKFLWNIRCSDTGSSSNFSAGNRTLILDTTAPNITWNLPANDNSSIVGSWFVQNITVNDTNLADLNCTITNSSADVVWNTWWNLTGLTTFTVSNWTDISAWNTGTYNESCIARDLTFFFGS